MNPHLQPWAISPEGFPDGGFASDRLEYLLGYAILAPSPHNTQPWLFRINYSDVEIFADHRRALKTVDPMGRELLLACGAALYNLRVAAGYFGHDIAVQLFPETSLPALVARLTLKHRAETSSEDVVLFNALTRRRTNREPFRPDLVPYELLAELAETASREGAWLALMADDAGRTAVADLVARADKTQWAHHDFRKELAAWVRTDAEHQADGIPTRDFGVRDWMAFAGPALVRTFNRGNDQAARDADIALHSPVLAILGTETDDPESWVRGGQALEAVLLHAEANGIAASHLNQPVEVPELRPQLAALAGREGFPQIVLRLGYGPEIPPTPRREVRTVMLRQDTTKSPPH